VCDGTGFVVGSTFQISAVALEALRARRTKKKDPIIQSSLVLSAVLYGTVHNYTIVGNNSNWFILQTNQYTMHINSRLRIVLLVTLGVYKVSMSNAFVAFRALRNVHTNTFGYEYAIAVKRLFSKSQPEDGQNIKKNTSKYVLGNEVDLEESDGFYWNSFKSVNDVKYRNPDDKLPQGSKNHSSDTNSTDASSAFNLTGKYELGLGKNDPIFFSVEKKGSKNLMVSSQEGKFLSRAFWFYDGSGEEPSQASVVANEGERKDPQIESNLRYEDIDQSICEQVYDPSRNIDLVWSLLQKEAKIEAEREPLLVSFLYSTILNHPNLESALAFHLANRLTSPSMDSIQIMNIILDALMYSPTFRRDLRADIIAVRNRDPACTCLPDVFLYFKGYHALQAYRVSHHLWRNGKKTLAHYVQSQISQNFQIDIHPNATLKSGIMLDHGTGVVIGETAVVGHNCSILHGVTLGGSGKGGVDRHPKIKDGVLLGAGATVLGNIHIGEGCQVGAGTLVIDDLPAHSVAVGVPSKIIGSYKEEAQPSQNMNQVGSYESEKSIESFTMDGI